MKRFPAFMSILLLGACLEDESQVKDMRDPDAIVEDAYIPDDSKTTDDETDTAPSDSSETEKSSRSEWSYEVIFLSENNWGYQIFQEGKMIIKQTSIPSIRGIDGFDTQEKAERTAQFIINKVENGLFPPTVNKEELEELGVLRD